MGEEGGGEYFWVKFAHLQHPFLQVLVEGWVVVVVMVVVVVVVVGGLWWLWWLEGCGGCGGCDGGLC